MQPFIRLIIAFCVYQFLSNVCIAMATTIKSSSPIHFGKFCNSTIACGNISSLSCSSANGTGICQCRQPDEMMYDAKRDICIVQIGNMCKHYGENALTFQCVGGAICKSKDHHGHFIEHDYYSAKCECGPTHYEDGNGMECLPKGGHGSSCQSHVECDQSQKLACHTNGKCGCFAQDAMEYTPEAKECRIKLGHNCKSLHEKLNISGMPILLPAGMNSADHGRRVREEKRYMEFAFYHAKCMNGTGCDPESSLCAKCNPSMQPTCFCPEGEYMDYRTVLCTPVKNEGEPCQHNNPGECNRRKLLTCLPSGFCACDPAIAILARTNFDHSLYVHDFKHTIEPGICVGKIGTKCSVNTRDMSFRHILHYVPHDHNVYCHENAQCESNLCKCQDGYTPNKFKMCGGQYDEVCSLSRQCSDNLICTRLEATSDLMKCRCPNQKTQWFDPTPTSEGCAGSCKDVQLVGHTCEITNPSCIQNSACVSSNHNVANSTAVCKCTPGFIPNANHGCDIEYGQACGDVIDNNVEHYCDREAGLECRIVSSSADINGPMELCSCPNLEDIFDRVTRKCIESKTKETQSFSVTVSKGPGWCKM